MELKSNSRNLLKRVVTFTLALMMVLTVIAPVSVSAAGYGFKSKGVTVKPGSSASSFISANKCYLQKTSNSKSCIANSGYDITRKYKYFTLVTYASKKNGTGKVESIAISNKSVTTPEGLKCGDKVSKLKKCYSKASKIGSNYSVLNGKTKIIFKISNSKVSKITYLYTGTF